MAKKAYHFSPTSQRFEVCPARIKCTLKGADGKPAEHKTFNSVREAKEATETKLASQHGSVASVKNETGKPKRKQHHGKNTVT